MSKKLITSFVFIIFLLGSSTNIIFSEDNQPPNFYYSIFYNNGSLIFLSIDRTIDFEKFEIIYDGKSIFGEIPIFSLPAEWFENEIKTVTIRLIDEYDVIVGENIIEDMTYVSLIDGSFSNLPEKVYSAKVLVLPSSDLEHIPGVSQFRNLKRLYAIDSEFRYWSGIQELTNLEALYCFYCDGYIEPLENLTELEELAIDIVWMLTDYPVLEIFSKLKFLQMHGMTFSNLTTVPKLSSLEVLVIYGMIDDYDSLNNLSSLPNLSALELYFSDLNDITFAKDLKQLKYLGVEYANINDISPVANLTNLIGLSFNSNNIVDISPLENLTNLTKILVNNNNIKDISVVENFEMLKYLDLENNNISDISPLAQLKNLNHLLLINNPIDDFSALENLNETVIIK